MYRYKHVHRNTKSFDRLLIWIWVEERIRKPKTDSCDISENSFEKIRGCHIVTLSLLMAKVILSQI